MMIGLSLSICIWEVSMGVAKERHIEKIVTSSDAVSSADWDRLIRRYQERYWYRDPKRGERIVRRLLDEGKVLQPRLDPIYPRIPCYAEHRWVRRESEIIYIPYRHLHIHTAP